jgi:pimeloyl-ACP methyl ester carboxylesterase
MRFVGYPGFGATSADPNVNGIEDLVGMVAAEIDQPTALVAQSMGGVIATLVALRCPNLVTHLVLVATSGGIDISGLGAEDWRESFAEANPLLPNWFAMFKGDFSSELVRIEIPILLIWGDDDPISPVAVGQKLEKLFPTARLLVVPGGQHDLANKYAAMIAPLVESHLSL